MEIIPITIATISIPTGMFLLVEAYNQTVKNQTLIWASIFFILFGLLMVFWANWLVYQRRKEEIKRNYEERLMRTKELDLLNKMSDELKDLSRNKGK